MTTLSTVPEPVPLPKVNFTWSPVGALITFSFAGNNYPPAGSRFEANYTPVNQLITFTGSAVTAPGTSIVEWRWNLGDGVIKFGQIVGHTYVVPNPSVSARLEATDSLNRTVYIQKVLLLQVQFATVIEDHLRV